LFKDLVYVLRFYEFKKKKKKTLEWVLFIFRELVPWWCFIEYIWDQCQI